MHTAAQQSGECNGETKLTAYACPAEQPWLQRSVRRGLTGCDALGTEFSYHYEVSDIICSINVREAGTVG
jgi:hypothetical protein